MLTDTSSSPAVRLRSVPINAVHWTGGFWRAQFQRCQKVMVPNLWRLLADPEISHAYANFRVAAGDEEGDHLGPQWHDGDFYKWLEAAGAVYAVARDEGLDRLMDEIIATIVRVQRRDGYIHTPVIIKRRRGAQAEPFQERLAFETYNMGHLLTAACIHHRATGKESLLTVARKAADYLYRVYQEAAPALARSAVCPSHYMGVIELYRTTRDPRYLELGRNLIEMRDLVTGGSDDNQDRLPFREQREAAGHAVRANYLYAGVADVVAETGDRPLLAALEALWVNAMTHKMSITGGCGALYDGASPDGSPDQASITRVHQAYGRDYQLPNVTAHNETCASVGNVLWNWRMLALTGDARFADVVELGLFNALSGIGLDGKSFFYTNTLRQVSLPFELRWSRTRQPYITCFCCPPNLVRMIAEVGGYAYSVSDEGVWVNLYGSNSLDTCLPDGSRLKLAQQSDYPWDGRVRLVIEEPARASFAVMLRVPGWAKGSAISINGQALRQEPAAGQYVTLERAWAVGDVIELNLALAPRLVEAHPLVEEARNHVAVMRGPLVYCLESPDLPAGVRPSEVIIPRTIELQTLPDRSLGEDVMALVGRAKALPEQAAWTSPLYREVRSDPLSEVDVKLIPYFAWANRGPSEMTVWMPVAW